MGLGGLVDQPPVTTFHHFPAVWTAMRGGYSAQEMAGVAQQWVWMHWVRLALGHALLMFAILATVRGHGHNAVPVQAGTVRS